MAPGATEIQPPATTEPPPAIGAEARAVCEWRRPRHPSWTPRSGPGFQPRPALQLSEQVRSLLRMVVRRLQQHASACRLSLRHTSARPCQGDMPHQFAELVAGGFDFQVCVPSVAVSRGQQ